MRKIILTCNMPPGDLVMLTAAIRDLHRLYPKQFQTDVRTWCRDVFDHNPNIVPIKDNDEYSLQIHAHYPSISTANQRPRHFIEGYHDYLSEMLERKIVCTDFKGDIHIGQDERQWFSRMREITGKDIPYWVMMAGGKTDFTVKWWLDERWQEVVDRLSGKVLFIQAGHPDHHHPPLKGVINQIGRTTIRQFIRLVQHAQGVVCPITSAMHFAAAVPLSPVGGWMKGTPRNRPCVVLAGGREPLQWYAYPGHQVLHVGGALYCCDNGGCWKSRTVPIGDGAWNDKELCVNTVDLSGRKVQKCMEMISSDDVVRAIGRYLDGTCRTLTAEEYEAVKPHLT